MGTNFGPASIGANSVSGSSGTWAANGLGASFEERAGAASASSAGGDFESRAGSLTSSSTGEPRWPQSRFSSDSSSFGGGDSSNRFGDTSARFCDQGRFTDRSEFSSSDDRFPASAFNDNRNGLDTSYNSINKF